MLSGPAVPQTREDAAASIAPPGHSVDGTAPRLPYNLDTPGTSARADLESQILARPRIVAALGGRKPLKAIHAGGKLVNIVVR